MNLNAAALKFEGASLSAENSTCQVCGQSFETPLLAKSSDSMTEEYYACPLCLSKVTNLHKKPEIKENLKIDDEIEESLAAEIPVEGNVKGPGNCMHYLGYLKQHKKSKPMPEECLTCNKMIDCMY
jgi:DNA-directed RNA polymerase subunit RPC12/RpoP